MFQRVLGFFTRHQPEDLLSFDHVRDKLKIRSQHYAGTQEVPLDKVVGSVGRYHDFNRAFLPTQEYVRERWKRVYAVAHGATGFPPIDVYKIGDLYFVRDGHHRVSVLKELGAPTIEATVTELETPISLSPDIGEEELDLKEEYADFLRATGLDALRVDQEIEFTLPGQYQKLLVHIAGHRYFLGLHEQREIAYPEAVARWYDEVYRPVVDIIRETQILDEFPERTEADLYLWIIEHRHYLGERYGSEVPLEEAASQFSEEFATGPGKKQLEAEIKKVRGEGQRKKERIVAVFGSGSAPPDDPVVAQAERLGQLLAQHGFTVMCGGYGGTMEATSRGAQQAGGEVIGVTMDLFADRDPNPYLTKEKRVRDFYPRLKQLSSADGFVVLMGGIGTLTEATLVWSLLETGQISARPFVFVGGGWRDLFDAFRAVTFMRARDFDLATVVDQVDDVLPVLEEAWPPGP
jgi:uncharacterized protein (TIGR00730 family)